MFVATQYLVMTYGIDEKIAKFFVDREPPKDNLYWHEKLLYLRPGVGYNFIPMIVDILYKLGIDRNLLLNDPFLSTMERIGHISALEEIKKIDRSAAIKESAALVKPISKDLQWFNEVKAYLEGRDNGITSMASSFKALHRGDLFLFTLCTLEIDDILQKKVIKLWFALITTLLLLDDAADAKEDMITGEENAFLENEMSMNNIELSSKLVATNVATLSSINIVMATEFDRQFKVALQKPMDLLTAKN